MLKFEVNLGAALDIKKAKSTIITEGEDPRDDIFDAPEPLHPTPSNRICQTDQEVFVVASWVVNGTLAALLDGSWKVQVFLEQFGKEEASPGVYSKVVPHVQKMQHKYKVKVTLPGDESIKAGLYRIAIIVNLLGPAPKNMPLPVAGFEELGTIQYYDAV